MILSSGGEISVWKTFTALLLLFSNSTLTTTSDNIIKFYVVRHAEKAATTDGTTDVSFSLAGKERAEALKEILKKENINFITSTNTKRTMSTAEPLSNATGKRTHHYDHRDTALLNRYKNNPSGNMLFVGHSNTVDDIVNFFMGRNVLQDLPATAYGDLFMVIKKGDTYSFDRKRFGK
jgi:broad specificity phosphatase PhoE